MLRTLPQHPIVICAVILSGLDTTLFLYLYLHLSGGWESRISDKRSPLIPLFLTAHPAMHFSDP